MLSMVLAYTAAVHFQGDMNGSVNRSERGVKRRKPKTASRPASCGKPLRDRYAELLKLRQAVLKAQSQHEHQHDRRRVN
jgi:hypothetical protein